MSNKDKIAIKLNHQFDLIWESLKALEYLINFPHYLKFTNDDKPKDLWFLYFVIRNNTVLNLNKLYNPNEDYSFDKTKALLLKSFDKTDEGLKDILTTLKIGKNLFKKLDLKNIRDKHVGHLDENRTEKNLNWEKVKELVRISYDLHDKMNIFVFKKHSGWVVDEKILNNLFTKDLRTKKLFELKREFFLEDKAITSEDILLNLAKIKWP
jgi:hypothetical protein